jgi:putative membrane protein insertion efficiency factor
MSWAARIAAGLIRVYQLVLSPWVTQQCRYYPSCSQYALDAVRTRGAIRGTGLAVWRLLRCNPWSRGGVDYVPGANQGSASEPQHSCANRDVTVGPTDLGQTEPSTADRPNQEHLTPSAELART